MPERVPHEQLHPILEEGNKTPPQIIRLLDDFKQREPQPTRGRRIALGLTLLREVDAKVALRWFQLLRSHWWPGEVYNGRGQYTVQARNLVLKQAFDDLDAWDDLLFWDADQVPPLVVPGPIHDGAWQGGWFADYIDWLSATQPDKAVIAGLYFSREDYWQTDQLGQVKAGPHEPVAYNGDVTTGTYRYLTLEEVIPMLQRPGFYPVKGAGTGSMLIRKQTLLELAEMKAPKPVFEAPELKPGDPGGGPGTQWTEDLYFCHELQSRLGKTIWLDSAMQSAHVAEIWITAAHYLETRGIATKPHQQSLKRAGEGMGDPDDYPQRSRIWTPAQR